MLLRQQRAVSKKVGKAVLYFFIQNGTHKRLHSSAGLDGVELRLTKKDNRNPHGINAGD